MKGRALILAAVLLAPGLAAALRLIKCLAGPRASQGRGYPARARSCHRIDDEDAGLEALRRM
jgi:hypothetical protein